MNITIIGLGLIGGSMALDLKSRKFADKILGVDNSPENTKLALKLGIADEICTLKEAVNKSDLVLICTPADAAVAVLKETLDLVHRQTVIDCCSTKAALCKAAANHPKRENYVAAHPMAGTEFSGPKAAVRNLFDQKPVLICEAEKSSLYAVSQAKSLFEALNMKISFMDSDIHDMHAAYVSHISHISSFVLALATLEKEQNHNSLLEMAGGGFRSTVRLANSSAQMWTPILLQNKTNVIEVIDAYAANLQKFKTAIQKSDSAALNNLITDANRIYDLIN